MYFVNLTQFITLTNFRGDINLILETQMLPINLLYSLR